MPDDAIRRLPQGCQVEQPYTDEEWKTFLACARRGFESGEGLHREFYPKIDAHGVEERDVLLALRNTSMLLTYRHDGMGRLAVWDGGRDILVIGTVKEGLILNAFKPDNVERYVRRLVGARWLRR